MARACHAERHDHTGVKVVAIDGHIDVVAEDQGVGVRRGQVVGLVEGVDGRLPVAFDLDGDVVEQHHLFKMIGVEVLGNDTQVFSKRFSAGIEVDPDHPAPGFAAHRRQAEFLRWATLGKRLRVLDRFEGAIDSVPPAVEEARKTRSVAAPRFPEPVSPVTTYIEAGSDLIAVLADDENGLAADFGCEIIPRFGNVACETGEKPGSRPHAVPLQPCVLGGSVFLARNSFTSQVGCREVVERGPGQSGIRFGSHAAISSP